MVTKPTKMQPEEVIQISPLVRRITAGNSSVFTGPGTNTYLIGNEEITVFGQGKQIRDFVYVPDIIPFFDNAIVDSKFDNETYNLGTGNGTTIIEIIEKLASLLSIKPKINFQPERPGEIGNFVSDTHNLESKFDSKPETSIEDGLKQTMLWANKT